MQKHAVCVRLAKIIGQVKAASKMVETQGNGIRLLTLCAAVDAAISSLMLLILRDAERAGMRANKQAVNTAAHFKNIMTILIDNTENGADSSDDTGTEHHIFL